MARIHPGTFHAYSFGVIIRSGPPCSGGSGLPSHVCTSNTSSSTARAKRKTRRVRHMSCRGDGRSRCTTRMRRTFRYDELRECLEADAAPMVVVAAPRRHAVEVAHIVGLREFENCSQTADGISTRPQMRSVQVRVNLGRSPRSSSGQLQRSADRPGGAAYRGDWCRRSLAAWHAEGHINVAATERDLALDVTQASFDQIG